MEKNSFLRKKLISARDIGIYYHGKKVLSLQIKLAPNYIHNQ